MSDIQEIAKGTAPKKDKEIPGTEIEALKAETLKLDLEAKKLELLERQANLQDLQERLAERELGREVRRQRNKTNGATLTALAAADKMAQKRCTHKKGGDGAAAVIGGQGQSGQYAVLKHTFANGDMWVRCLRCGKTWKPPILEDFDSERAFLAAEAEYQAAINFSTLNVPSGGCQFRFSDNGKYYREVTRFTTLR
jgi:hypothetical protein